MTPAESIQPLSGFALRCRADGTILEVISGGGENEQTIAVGGAFDELIDAASRAKAEAFRTALRERKSAFGWELNVKNESGKIESMHFAGALAEERADDGEETFLIVVARSRAAIPRFYNDLMRLNNEQTNSLRAALKDLSLQTREQTERDGHFYDELSRLNNELTTAQRELAKKNSELARLNEQKNQFLGIASHDLRNPLEVIMTYSDFLREEAAGVLSAEHADFIDKIYSSSAYMLALVNDFLDYAKIEAGRLDLYPEPTDLAGLTREIVERSRVLADKKRIRINYIAPEDLPEISLDASKTEQVLSNLIGNAVKFSPAGGAIEVNIKNAGSELVVSVKDSGEGIAADDAATLFAPFVRGTTKTTGGEKSTGLGLAIVKRIVEAHGGAISFETEAGKGSVFFVALPLKFERGKN